MKRAIYKGRVMDKNMHAVHLFYEYRGKEYMITDEHNGYSETMRSKHAYEQARIDEMLDRQEPSNEEAERAQKELKDALDKLFEFFES